MHCPKCGFHAGQEGSRFCRNCGFRLDGVAQLLAHNGMVEPTLPQVAVAPRYPSPRKNGLKQGGKLLFACVALFPIFLGLSIGVGSPEPMAFPAIVLFAGLVRMLYARLFEEDYSQPAAAQPVFVALPTVPAALPSYQAPVVQPQAPTSVPTTGHLEPPSVIEPTTNLLNRQ
ncbi:MAG: zinc ribbon domain-containing protein [Acidobacteriota bacterium]|nr:zinc ribbon domain-containing protein [Acidobacteriota bacterium]